MKKFLACFIILCTILSIGCIAFATYNDSEHTFDSYESAKNSSIVSARIGGSYQDSIKMNGSVSDNNEVDIYKLHVQLANKDYLAFKLQVPDGNDYDLYILDYYGKVIGKSKKGAGENEYITIKDPTLLKYAYSGFDYFYVKVEYFSGNSGQYRLDVKTVDGK
ncbi:hypothetical protein PV797_02050 [Clostridiaceae bacterium M8S5]|nr:hypothetical protein PV797_02050 [Clostridiaceae bacterium M8S5]